MVYIWCLFESAMGKFICTKFISILKNLLQLYKYNKLLYNTIITNCYKLYFLELAKSNSC